MMTAREVPDLLLPRQDNTELLPALLFVNAFGHSIVLRQRPHALDRIGAIFVDRNRTPSELHKCSLQLTLRYLTVYNGCGCWRVGCFR